jgi:hypothetical protein
MLTSDYVVAAMNSKLEQIRTNGDIRSSARVVRQLGSDNAWNVLNYPIDFIFDAGGVNPARAFHGSIAGRVSSSAPFDVDGVSYVTLNVKMHDAASAPSSTHYPPIPGVMKYGGAVVPQENPYGSNRSMRTINVQYNLKVTVPLSGVPWSAAPTWKGARNAIGMP